MHGAWSKHCVSADTWPAFCSLWPTYLTDRMRVGYLSDEALACEQADDLIRD